jgi:RNA 3'-terminal phosphate cyclase (ATP)
MVSKLNRNIGHREIKVVRDRMAFPKECCQVVEIKNSPGPGNILVLEIVSENITEVFTGLRKKPNDQNRRPDGAVERVVNL